VGAGKSIATDLNVSSANSLSSIDVSSLGVSSNITATTLLAGIANSISSVISPAEMAAKITSEEALVINLIAESCNMSNERTRYAAQSLFKKGYLYNLEDEKELKNVFLNALNAVQMLIESEKLEKVQNKYN
jgi:hypothetical protein